MMFRGRRFGYLEQLRCELYPFNPLGVAFREACNSTGRSRRNIDLGDTN